MAQSRSGVIGGGSDQLAATQMVERRVHGALRKSGRVGNATHTGWQ